MRSILFCILINISISFTLQNLDEFLLKNIENSIKKLTKESALNNNNQITQDSRQFGLYNKPNSGQFGLYNKPNSGQFGLHNKPNSGQFGLYSTQYADNYNDNKYGLYNSEQGSNGNIGFQPTPPKTMNFLEALESVALHDSLRCIPKLLCDFMVERTRPNHQQSSLIPNFDMSSLLSYIENVGEGAPESPVLLFGKAAILGYSAQGNSYKCIRAYPQCPNNPDQLLHYLNNHNGGFFRFFNGLPNRSQYGKNNNEIQKRIQTKPSYSAVYESSYHPNTHLIQQGVKFPLQNQAYSDNHLQTKEYIYVNGRFIPYKPSTPSYQSTQSIRYSDSHIKIPSYSQVGVVFPDRTGTGELLLDSTKFDNKYKLKFPYY